MIKKENKVRKLFIDFWAKMKKKYPEAYKKQKILEEKSNQEFFERLQKRNK
mgnify:CR=1 FL=1|jgi:hypothetical protein